ncbi:MAG: Unknown protein [uncultured Campylobacterales bacterium]|uniref:CBU-0592-like domain-containing protein n=1 Tax=uncultured Campylobacterales bacterium TaxID=352960 RepID=A0A6S6S0P8_9BACT|nr:MAG: Unknown protein [uncultured Campylobacterales bacterium]
MLPDIIGTIGVGIIVFFYFLLQTNKIDSNSLNFSIFNTIGSAMILYSLWYTPNFASIVIEVFWLIISVYGVISYFRRPKF